MSRTLALAAVACALLVGRPAAAQTHERHASTVDAVATQKALWTTITNYVTQSAEMMPEAEYAFRPSDDVRTFGQLIAHIAGAQYVMCGAAIGESGHAEDAIEKSKTTKAELVEALKASTAYCEKAYAQTDAAAAAKTTMFGMNVTRLYALGMNLMHNGEHYGNLVTYMRMKGHVPPSSRGSGM